MGTSFSTRRPNLIVSVVGRPTGTAFILQYDDRDNAIVLIGGANQAWPSPQALSSQEQGADLRSAINEVCPLNCDFYVA